jgi:hypothetical protein
MRTVYEREASAQAGDIEIKRQFFAGAQRGMMR